MFITRATRHDKDDLRKFYESQEWEPTEEGVAFIARDGEIVGTARLIDVAPQTVVIEDVVVAEDRRGQGIGASVMQAAMNSRGGTLYLLCHEPVIGFYEKFGFKLLPFENQPAEVRAYFERNGDWPTEPGHVHHFMTAR
jgi:N-acetylglutamate synthase-like GNAT family acetyltransferase